MRPSTLPILSFISLALLALVLLYRITSAVDAFHTSPGTAITSGCEEESWLNIWNTLNGKPTFPNPLEPPYNAAYFNWLFYKSYSIVSGCFVHHLGDSYLILSGRFFTLAFALLGIGITFLWLCRIKNVQKNYLLALVIAAYVFTGPLVGWWAFTVRPDVAALSFESLSILCLLMWGKKNSWAACIGSAIALQAAWAMKPSYVGGVAVAGLYLLLCIGWRQALFFGVLTLTAWGGTLALGGAGLRAALIEAGTNNHFSLELFFLNTSAALLRLTPLLLLLPFTLVTIWKAAQSRTYRTLHDPTVLGIIGVVVCVPLYGLASAKNGASANYWMPVSLYLVCLISSNLSLQANTKPLFLYASLLVIIFIQAGIGLGRWGKISLHQDTVSLTEKWDIYKSLPEPRFSYDYRLNLPWLNPASPPYVLSFNYYINRAQGKTFIGNGLGGQIEAGSLNGLLLPLETADDYDGAKLGMHYNRILVGSSWAAYQRKKD
jgi:hypothetical protein